MRQIYYEKEMQLEKKVEASILAAINKHLPNQGSTEVSTSIAAVIAAPPGLSPIIENYNISDVYESDWNADMKLLSSAEATVASITASLASTCTR